MKTLLLKPDSYTNANSWRDLAHTFTGSLKNSSLDEMILLIHTNMYDPRVWGSKYVRAVTYRRLDEVPKLLSTAPSAPRTGLIPSHQQRPRAEEATEVQPDSNNGEQEKPESIEIPRERITDGREAEVSTSGGDHEEEIDESRVNAAKAIQDAYRRRLERKRIRAAKKIQVAYRRHLKRKIVVRKGIEATQAHFWKLLRERSKEMEWTKDSRYYLLFRVPLADILVCLSAIKAFAESGRNEARKRMMTEDHKGLEESMEALDQHRCDMVGRTLYQGSNESSSKLLKKTNELQKKLSPSSKFHEGRSVSNLQDAVQEVKSVVESLDDIPGSIGTRDHIRKRWDRGSKWIFEKQGSRAKGKKAEKPKLMLDREDLLYL